MLHRTWVLIRKAAEEWIKGARQVKCSQNYFQNSLQNGSEKSFFFFCLCACIDLGASKFFPQGWAFIRTGRLIESWTFYRSFMVITWYLCLQHLLDINLFGFKDRGLFENWFSHYTELGNYNKGIVFNSAFVIVSKKLCVILRWTGFVILFNFSSICRLRWMKHFP